LRLQIDNRYSEKPSYPYTKNTYFRSSRSLEEEKKAVWQAKQLRQ
jgi:hypothetical protein